MKNQLLILSTFVFFLITSFTVMQKQSIAGKWKAEDGSILEISKTSDTEFTIKQVSTPVKKDKYADGKVIGTMKPVSTTEWKGELKDVKEDKGYKARFNLEDGKIAVSVKWGLLSFSDTWTRID